MKRSNRLILLIGVFLAIVAFVLIVVLFNGNRGGGGTTPQAARELPTVIAVADIPLGTPIQADQVTVEQKPITGRDANAFGDVSQVIGKIVREPVAPGAAITPTTFGTTAGGTIQTVTTPPGQVAMAVQVDQVSGVGTLVRAGDYVDLVVGFNIKVITVDPDTGAVAEGLGVTETSTKLLVQGVQVLGTLLPPPPARENGEEPAEGGTALTGQSQIVIVSVTPQQSEVIKHTQLTLGGDPRHGISLVLRSTQDFIDPNTQEPIVPPVVETTGITLQTLVDDYGVLVPQVIEAELPPDLGGAGDPTP